MKTTLDIIPEQSPGAISEAEERFERWRRRVGLALAPLVLAVLWFLPVTGLTDPAHRLLAVFGFVITLWVTEPIPLAVTALIGPALCVVCGVASEREVFRSFGNPILFLFMGSFLLAEAMLHHGLNRRIAFSILGLKWVAKTPGRVLFSFGAVTGLLSMWISNTAAAAMMLPIGLAILTEMAGRKSVVDGKTLCVADLRYGTGLMLATAFAASIGGMATPVGTPPNLIGIGFIERTLGRTVSFFQWMAFGVPLAILLIAFLGAYLNRVCRAEPGLMDQNIGWIREQKAQLGPLRRAEKNVLTAFVITVILWVLPGPIGVILGLDSTPYRWLNSHLPEGVAALMGAGLLFFLPLNLRRGEFTLTWREATRIDWGTIMLFGGGLALGDAMFTTGLAKWLGEGIAKGLHANTSLSLIIVFAVIAVLLTETTSNTATANMVVPVAIAVSQAAGVDPLGPAVAACLSASLAFMLPVSTPPNAVVYASGCVPLLKMVRHGLVLDLVSVTAVVITVYWILPFVMRL